MTHMLVLICLSCDFDNSQLLSFYAMKYLNVHYMWSIISLAFTCEVILVKLSYMLHYVCPNSE